MTRHHCNLSGRRRRAVDQLGAHSLFTGMSQLSTTSPDDGEILDIMHDEGGFEDVQVDDSQLVLYIEQPGMYTGHPDFVCLADGP